MATSAGEGRGLGRAGQRPAWGRIPPHHSHGYGEGGGLALVGGIETPGLIQGFSKLAVSRLRGGEPAGWAWLQSPSRGCGGISQNLPGVLCPSSVKWRCLNPGQSVLVKRGTLSPWTLQVLGSPGGTQWSSQVGAA